MVALCATLTGCSFFSRNHSTGNASAPPEVRGAAAPANKPADEQWWQAATLTPGKAIMEGLFVADTPAKTRSGKGALPADLNKGKSFWSPDREFDYLFANYEYPKQPFWRDYWNMKYFVWEDTKALGKPKYLITLGIGAALAGGLQPLDHRVNRHFHHTDVLHGWEKTGNNISNPATLFGVSGLLYVYSLAASDEVYRKRSTILLEGLAYNNLVTLALKAAFERQSPNGHGFLGIKDSFPSGHTSSAFAVAAMLDEMYGHQVGFPLYVVAGFAGFARLQGGDHYLSDCVFGAFLGYAIGHAVFERNKMELFGFKLEPLVEPESGAVGLALTRRF
jgi:hypothetical protein